MHAYAFDFSNAKLYNYCELNVFRKKINYTTNIVKKRLENNNNNNNNSI